MFREQPNKNKFVSKQGVNLPKLPIDCIHKNKYLSLNQRCNGNSEMCEQKCSRIGHTDQDHEIIDKDEFITLINLKKDKSIHITQSLRQRLELTYSQVKTKINAVLEAIYTEYKEQLKLFAFHDQDVKLIRLMEVGKFNSLCCSHIYYLNNISVDERQFSRKGQSLINKLKNIQIMSQVKNIENSQNKKKMLVEIKKQFEGRFNEEKKKIEQKYLKFEQRSKKLQEQNDRLRNKYEKEQKKLFKISTHIHEEDNLTKKTAKVKTFDSNEPQHHKVSLKHVSNIQSHPQNLSHAINAINKNLQQKGINKKLIDVSPQQMGEIKQKIAAKRAKRQMQKNNQNQCVFLSQQAKQDIVKEKEKLSQLDKQTIYFTNKVEISQNPINENKFVSQTNYSIGMEIKNQKKQNHKITPTFLKPEQLNLTPIQQLIPIQRQLSDHKIKQQKQSKSDVKRQENRDHEFGLYDPQENLAFQDRSQISYVPKINQNQFHFKQFKPANYDGAPSNNQR